MDLKKIAVGVVLVTGSVILLSYRPDNHAVLGKLIMFGILGLLASVFFLIKGLIGEAHTQGDVLVQ